MFIVNDHLDIAMASGADGVHLGQEDLPLKEARRILGSEAIIGVSTHNLNEVVEAKENGTDYVNIGPVFPTQTKVHLQSIKAEEISKVLATIVDMPFTFMGGIKESNIQKLSDYKPSALAMITEITKAQDINKKVRAVLAKIKDLPISY